MPIGSRDQTHWNLGLHKHVSVKSCFIYKLFMPTHTHTHTRTSCTWQQRSNKPNSENTDFLENYQVLTSFDLRVVVFFLPVLHRHVRNRRQPPSSPSLLEMERRMRQTAWNADSRPGRRSRGRRQRVLAEAERSTQPWHRLLQYCTFPVHMEGKIRQLWTIPMRLNDLHDFFFCCVQTPQLTNL